MSVVALEPHSMSRKFLYSIVFLFYLVFLWSFTNNLNIWNVQNETTKCDFDVDRWNLPWRGKVSFVVMVLTRNFLFKFFLTSCKNPSLVSQQRWQPFGRSWWLSGMEHVGKHVFSLFSVKTSFLKSTSRQCLRTTSLISRLTENRFVDLSSLEEVVCSIGSLSVCVRNQHCP